MAEDKFSLHVDSDWKKQAQEEKKKLAEQEAARKQQEQQQAATPAGVIATGAVGGARPAPGGRPPAGGRAAPGQEEPPQADFASLVQSLVTQVLYYLGDLAVRGERPMLNPDMAKYNLDMLNLLDEKTRGNLTPDEQALLDQSLYEGRMRYVSVASRLAELP